MCVSHSQLIEIYKILSVKFFKSSSLNLRVCYPSVIFVSVSMSLRNWIELNSENKRPHKNCVPFESTDKLIALAYIVSDC